MWLTVSKSITTATIEVCTLWIKLSICNLIHVQIFVQIFVQQFELLQKACISDHVSYATFKESTIHANFSVSILLCEYSFENYYESVALRYRFFTYLFLLQTLAICDYFKEAQRIAKEVKSSFANDPDTMAELRKIELVAERNSIALNVCRAGALDPKLKISFAFCHHPFYATAIVKRSWYLIHSTNFETCYRLLGANELCR